MVKKKSSSFTEQLAELSNPAPSLDPEAADSDTEAKIVDFDDNSSGDELSNGYEPSQLRKLTSLPLSEDDQLYAGLTTSRNEWLAAHSQSDSGSDDKDEEEEDSEEEEEKGGSSNNNLMNHFKNIAAEIDEESDSSDEEQPETAQKGLTQKKAVLTRELLDKSDDMKRSSEEDDSEMEEEEESDDESKEEEEENEEEDDTGFSSEENETAVKSFAQGSLQEELRRRKATKAQLGKDTYMKLREELICGVPGLWDNLLESRIKLQKAISLTNQMAQYDTLDKFVDEGGEHLEEALSKGREELKNLVSAMIELQDTLLLHNPETTHVVDGSKQEAWKHSDGENEEIPSDDEDISNNDEEIASDDKEISSDDKVESTAPRKQENKVTKGTSSREESKGKLTKQNLESTLLNVIRTLKSIETLLYRNGMIERNYHQAKSVASSFDKSPLAQIQQVLQDKVRLIKRTQLKRTSYKVLGKADEDDKEMKEEEAMTSHNTHLKDYDPEIFDDDDFYHQLLRELIEKKTADTSDPVQLTRQWLEVQKLRSKVKK